MYEDSGFLMDATTGFTTIDQRAKNILYGTDTALHGCTANDKCCKCPKACCKSEKNVEDLMAVLKKLSQSSASRLSKVSKTLNHFIVDIKSIFVKTDEPPSREALAKDILKTFKTFEKIVSNQTESIGIVSADITRIFPYIQKDLLSITEARSVKIKNSAASDLGNHIIILIDTITELTKMASSVSASITDDFCQGIISLVLVTSTMLYLVEETLATIAVQVSKVGFQNDTSSSIFLHVCMAVERYNVIIQRIAKCPNGQPLKKILPTVTTSLSTLNTELIVRISSTTGFVNKYPVPPAVTGTIDCIMESVRNSKHLRDAEIPISEAIFSLFKICNSIVGAGMTCSSIDGFAGNVDILLRMVLLNVHTVIVLLVNIDDDIFSCGNSLTMFLTTINLAVLKVMHSIDEVIQSILRLGEITEGGASLTSAFEAAVNVASSVVQCVAYVFSELKYGSHLVNLPKVIPGIMCHVKNQSDAGINRLDETLAAGATDHTDHSEIFKEASSIILSYMEFKHNIPDVICNLEIGEGNDTVDDSRSATIDKFIGKIKNVAEVLSSDIVGSVIAVKLNEICDEAYDVLILLSTVALEKWEVLKIITYVISNFYFALVSLSSIINCSHEGINISVF